MNKNISNIQYNSLNLPSVVTFGNGNTITYLYTADGRKLRTVHVIGNTTTTTDYCGNVIYENGTAKLLLTEAGYVDLTDNSHHFYIKDHLGNNRVVADANGNVEESNQYYPFGLNYADADSNLQPYKYNGKELDSKAGLNWYDYGARHYDAALGRWNVVDPLAEKYYSTSPYTYCGNNPIRYIDFNGMFYDGYTIDEEGYIKKVNDEGGVKYDVLYNQSRYSEQTRKDYDTTGDRTGIKISKGIIKEEAGEKTNYSKTSVRAPIIDSEGHRTGKVRSAQSYEISSDAESLSIMNFLDQNTKVEWGNTLLSNSEGKTVNILVTSHENNTVRFNGYFIDKKKGYKVIRADHIHPRNTTSVVSDNDRNSARNILKSSSKAKFRILHKGKYYNY